MKSSPIRLKIRSTIWNLWNAYQGNRRVAEGDNASQLVYRLLSLYPEKPEFYGCGAEEVSKEWDEYKNLGK